MTYQTSRRGFLTAAAASATILAVGYRPDGLLAATGEAASLNPFVKISGDGTVTAVLKHFEMGQGTTTGLTTLIAEELDADWSAIEFEFAPADNKRYKNLAFGSQGTGGSTAIANSFGQYRSAAAAARAVIVQAAAAEWGVKPDAISIEDGVLKSGNRSAGFGDFITAAAKLDAPAEPTLKAPEDFRLIGKATLPRKDSAAKTDGSAKFGLDMRVPGMARAVILRSPKFGGTLKSFDIGRAKKVSGFIDAKEMPGKSGVAIFGETTWAALSARGEINAEWDFSKAETRGTDDMLADAIKSLDAPSWQAGKEKDAGVSAKAIKGAAKTVEAEFHFPLLAHAPMEPSNCIIEKTAGGVTVHDGCQFPALAQPTVAAILGLKPEQVTVNTVYAGGSFGRRANPTADYQAEAAMAFALLGGERAVQLVWSREDDIKGGYYRPMAVHKARIGVDEDGNITGWDHRIASNSIMKGTPFESFLVHDGVDHSSVEGAADTPYAIPAMTVGLSDITTPMRTLWWRSVGHTHSAYAMESLVDMAAEAAGKDPLEMRLELLKDAGADGKRLSAVLKLAAEKAGWGGTLSQGRGRGIALHKSFDSYVAEVVEVSVDDGDVRIEKVTCAVDCGIAINPDVIKAQIEGGLGYGLGAIMRNHVTMTDGVVDQSNFPDYEPLRITDMPAVEVHIVESAEAPTGIGEPGTPPIGPALANAIYAATGERITRLPMSENGISFA